MRHLFAGGPVFGGTFPALIFRQFMIRALAGEPVGDPPRPAGTAPAVTPRVLRHRQRAR